MMRNAKSSTDKDPSDDICPVCKSNRYLNPSLKFLINPECYHKMCSTCVDRIFTSGPASCPVPYCGKTLRKKGFHAAFFGDLKVEREVDIRKRVGAIFNRRQDEFETLLDWNNYLETVETLIFELVEGTTEERKRAEEKLKAYKESNQQDIDENRKAAIEESAREKRREVAEKEAQRQRRLAALREEQEEKLDIAQNQRDVLERLATTKGDATKITQQGQKKLQAHSFERRMQIENSLSALDSLTLRGLRKKEAPVAEKPFEAFGGMDLTPTLYVLQKDYENDAIQKMKHVPHIMAGGYNAQEFYSRSLFEAFSGLSVFIEDEVHKGEVKAEVKIKSEMEIDDVF